MPLALLLALLLSLPASAAWGWHCPYDEEDQEIMDACLDEGRSWAVCRAAAGLGPGHHTEDYEDNSGDCDGPPPPPPVTLSHPHGFMLENPRDGAVVSGVDVISGWVCWAKEIQVQVGRKWYRVAYGTKRRDTLKICGDSYNGFGLLFNWNKLGEGAHDVVLWVNDRKRASVTVEVVTFGEEFLEGAEGGSCFPFPSASETVCVEWEESQQNFVIVDTQ